MKRIATLLGMLLLSAQLRAAPPVADPDWPCVQRFVPTLTAGTYWSGPPSTQDWHADPAIASVVAAIAPRIVPQDTAVQKLQAYVATLPPPGHVALLATLFSGLVDETNRQRDEVVDRLRALTRRQREVSQIIENIPTPNAAMDPATRDEVTQRRDFLIRQFQETERTVRYACEVPVQLEARLGAFGRVLDGAQ